MKTLIAGGTQFTFSIKNPDQANSTQPRLESCNAHDQSEAWRQIVHIVADLCVSGQLGQNADPKRIIITLVNTGVPIPKR